MAREDCHRCPEWGAAPFRCRHGLSTFRAYAYSFDRPVLLAAVRRSSFSSNLAIQTRSLVASPKGGDGEKCDRPSPRWASKPARTQGAHVLGRDADLGTACLERSQRIAPADKR